MSKLADSYGFKNDKKYLAILKFVVFGRYDIYDVTMFNQDGG